MRAFMSFWVAVPAFFIAIISTPERLQAYDLSESLRVNGFLTFGASTVDKEGALYRAYADQPGGATEGKFDFKTNSLLGLQVEYDLSDQFGLTVQGVSRKNSEGNFAPSLEWAYATYHAGEKLDVRAGLLHTPLYRNTELDYINYARIWATNPFISQYTRGFSQLKGAELLYYDYWQGYEFTLQGGYGFYEPDMMDAEHIQGYRSNDIKVASFEIAKNSSRLKISYMHAHTHYQLGTLLLPTEEDGGTSMEEGDDQAIESDGEASSIHQTASLDFEFPLSELVISGGLSVGSDGDAFPSTENRYVSLAYPAEEFTPYLLYTIDIVDFEELNAQDEEESYSIGLRYDLDTGIALKGQVDRIYPSEGGGREWDTLSGDYFHAFTLVVDVAF